MTHGRILPGALVMSNDAPPVLMRFYIVPLSTWRAPRRIAAFVRNDVCMCIAVHYTSSYSDDANSGYALLLADDVVGWVPSLRIHAV